MKVKGIILFVFILLLICGSALCETKVLSEKIIRVGSGHQKDAGVVVVLCIDGYQYVAIMDDSRVSITQSYKVSKSWTVPQPIGCD